MSSLAGRLSAERSGLPSIPRISLAVVLLWLALALLSCGVEVGGSFQPSRLVVVVAFGLSAFWAKLASFGGTSGRILAVLMAVWSVWGALSLAWTPDFEAGRHEYVGLLLGFVTLITFLNLAHSTRNSLVAIRAGWVTAFAITVPIAAMELLFAVRLPHADPSRIDRTDATFVTFGNSNTYIAFILFALPFLLWSLEASRSRLGKIFRLALVAAGAGVVVLNGSRLGLVGVAAELVAWLFIPRLRSRRTFMRFIAVAVIVGAGWAVWQGGEYPSYASIRVASALSGEDESILIRKSLAWNGLRMIRETYGAGVGAGGFEATLLAGKGQTFENVDEFATLNPHNLWIEIFAKYGIIVGTLFVLWLGSSFVEIWRRRGLEGSLPLRAAERHAIVLFAGLPVAVVLNSAFLTYAMLWSALAFIAVVASRGSGMRETP